MRNGSVSARRLDGGFRSALGVLTGFLAGILAALVLRAVLRASGEHLSRGAVIAVVLVVWIGTSLAWEAVLRRSAGARDT